VDAETGKDVPREGFWVHGFSDSVKGQVTLREPSKRSTFSLVLPARDVRLRVSDDSNTYRLYEERFTATSDLLEVEVRLVPAHHIRLHGRVLERHAGRLVPLRRGPGLGDTPFVLVGRAGLDPAEDGSYSVRVPRERLALSTLNTSLSPWPLEVDLSRETGADYRLDVVLSK
jgi:hypothetical protein